ncbi:MAG TPA: class I SAM-dependent methyltransferase [Thermoanaerobaculia bacterium]|nr:class I SAM-dependent methyltransferase [Thermoanaerobaculia bacterium]
MTPEPSAALRRQYEVERELADRLRTAPKARRWRLYGPVYEELFRRLPDQPQLAQKADPAARAVLARLQTLLLTPFLDGVGTFLEVGAGDGSLVFSLASRVPRVYAVEASEVVLEGEGAPPNLQVLRADSERIALPEGSVDLAFSSHFVEHLHPDDLADHLREVRRVLRPGAAYVCVTPSRLLGPHDVSKHFSEVPRGLHLVEYTHGELGRALAAAGFARVRVLRGVGRAPGLWPLLPYAALEAALGLLPSRGRRRLLSSGLLPGASPEPPFRPLEQVKLAAWK